jgi:hypothetical protein
VVWQQDVDARWAVNEQLLGHHLNMELVPESAMAAAQRAEDFRLAAWYANERERITRQRARELDASIKASTRDTWYLEDAKKADALWAEEGAEARETELQGLRTAGERVYTLLTASRPDWGPDLAARYGLERNGGLADWDETRVRRPSINGWDTNPALREPVQLLAGYARSRDHITVPLYTGPKEQRLIDPVVTAGPGETVDLAGHQLRRLYDSGEVVRDWSADRAGYWYHDGSEFGGGAIVEVPSFDFPWSVTEVNEIPAGKPSVIEIPRTVTPETDPLGSKHELRSFTVVVVKTDAEELARPADELAWRFTYVRQTDDIYVPDARTAELLRQHPDFGLPVTVTRAAGPQDGSGGRQVFLRGREEYLRFKVDRARWRMWFQPDWEHTPATGYEGSAPDHQSMAPRSKR